MKKIYVKGYFGYKNFGDDIFYIVSQRIFDEYLPQFKSVYIGTNLPKEISKNAIVHRVSSNKKRKIREIMTIFTSKYIVYFGGSLFSTGGNNIFDIKYIFRRFRFFDKKLLSFGISVGPFKNTKDSLSTEKLLNRFKLLGVRDIKSVELVNGFNNVVEPTFTFDNAIYLRKIYPNHIKRESSPIDKLSVGISVCKYESLFGGDVSNEVDRLDSLKMTIERLIERIPTLSLKFFVFNGNEKVGDDEITDEFIKSFSSKVDCKKINYTDDTEDYLEELTTVEIMLGVRLHSAIISYVFDIPFLLVEYHNKCTEFLNTIKYPYRFNSDCIDCNLNSILTLVKEKENGAIPPDRFLKEYEGALDKMVSSINQ